MSKHCPKCGEYKPTDQFNRSKDRKDGLCSWCKSCSNENSRKHYKNNFEKYAARNKAFYAENPQAFRNWKLIARYGITLEQYQDMLDSQGGVCALAWCSKTPEENGGPLVVDHDHACCPGTKTCGKCVRGLLCRTCNLGLGHFNDSLELLESAAAYLGS